MSRNPVQVVVIVASRRDGRLAPQISKWFIDQVSQRDDMTTDILDLNDSPLPDSLDPNAPAVVAARPRLARADAFVLVVPEYNRSIPGPMKTLIDCFNPEWEAKPIGFVSYGLSMAGGIRAIEHLRQIFSEFHAVGMKDAVVFPRILEYFDAEGNFMANGDGATAAAKLMLDQLGWWAEALRTAKAQRAYGT